jgi:hypothetical protein
MIIDFRVPYEEQPIEIKTVFCEEDFYEVENLVKFKKTLDKLKTL